MAYGRKVVPPPATPFEEFMATTSEKMIAARLELVEFLRGIDEGDMSPTKKTKIKRGRATPPRHKLPILFF